MKVAQTMKIAEARFAEIEGRTGLSFSAHMMRNQRIQATGGRFSGAEASYDPLLDYVPSPPAAPAQQPVGGGFARMAQSDFDALIADAADRYGIHPALIKAITFVESNFRPDAVSPQGAMGLMQLMPATAEALGVSDPFDPWQNVDGGTRYIAQNLNRFDGNTLLALAAYHAGYPRVTNLGVTDLTDPEQRVLLPRETQTYIDRIELYLYEAQASYVLGRPFAA
jgi:soluble lytic murein transglycosylase-like protein